MVSQFGSLGYTIMGKTADLTVVQKTIIDTLHKEGKPQTFIAKEAGCSQSAVSKHVSRKLSGLSTAGLCGNTIGQDIQTLTYHSSTSNMAFHLKDVCSSNFTWPLNIMLN